MLARETRVWRRMPGALAAALFAAALLAVTLVPAPVRGDSPSLTQNPDASNTLTWGMNTSQGLILDNATLSGGVATLPWSTKSVSWSTASDFESNAQTSSNVTAGSGGLTLISNSTNRIADGDFSAPGTWQYVNGTGTPYRVNASWNPSGFAELQHVSASTEIPWNSMDSTSNWRFISLNNTAQGLLYPVTLGQMQGAGMVGMNVSSHTGAFLASAAWNFPGSSTNNANWSAVDRVVLWVKDNASLGLSFNLTAINAQTSQMVTSIAQPLTVGWQQVVVNLSELGPPSARANLSSVFLQVGGPATVPANTWVYFDDVRVGIAKIFDSEAEVSQVFPKANASSSAPGSAYLSFDWCLCNRSGVSYVSASMRILGPAGSYATGLVTPLTPRWSHFFLDASAYTTAVGTYNLTFWFHVLANDTAASNATLLVDNATFLFPDTHNGTYLSAPIPLGSDSQFLSLNWSASLPSATSARLSLRSGNGSASWNPWQNWTQPGPEAPSILPGQYFQVGVYLNTTNGSVAPVLQSFSLQTRHHVPSGGIVSDLAPIQGRFLRWRSLSASFVGAPSTAVTFYIGNGSYWTRVPADGNITSYPTSSLEWKAVLSTTDGALTPSLQTVNVTYEYIGNPILVDISPDATVEVATGASLQFSAVALDAGGHIVTGTLFDWHTSDPSGQVTNGLYVAGSPGTYNVTAVAVGWGVAGTVQVRVVGNPLAGLWPLLTALVVFAVLGFAGYEIAIRRMFAIDDVFLIAKDGRLILHNTRRMRADRDEDILSGMLTAIMAFLRDQDPEENGELKRFQVGGKTTLLERGEHVYLAAIYSGRVPGWAGKDLHRFMTELEAKFGDAFAHWSGSPEDLHELKEFMQRFVSRVRYRGASRFRRKEN